MGRIDAYLVCGGRYHDFDYARLRLLELLAEHEEVRVDVGPDYAATDAIAASAFLITYTCDVRPSGDEQKALRSFVEDGGRWLALHGTNAALDIDASTGSVSAPRVFPTLAETLGSQFLAHPVPIEPYEVTVVDPDHPLVAGIEAFVTEDELYLSELHEDLRVLLETRWTGTVPAFADADWTVDVPRPVMYLRRLGAGEVLYLTLGHCRGHYDMQPIIDYYPVVERGSWTLPVYTELLRRGIAWALARP